MSNEKIILKFINKEKGKTPTRWICDGIYNYKGNTLTSDGVNLINYKTIIATWKKDGVLLNMKKYSVTTSKIQYTLKRILENYNIKYIIED